MTSLGTTFEAPPPAAGQLTAVTRPSQQVSPAFPGSREFLEPSLVPYLSLIVNRANVANNPSGPVNPGPSYTSLTPRPSTSAAVNNSGKKYIAYWSM